MHASSERSIDSVGEVTQVFTRILCFLPILYGATDKPREPETVLCFGWLDFGE